MQKTIISQTSPVQSLTDAPVGSRVIASINVKRGTPNKVKLGKILGHNTATCTVSYTHNGRNLLQPSVRLGNIVVLPKNFKTRKVPAIGQYAYVPVKNKVFKAKITGITKSGESVYVQVNNKELLYHKSSCIFTKN